MNLFLSRGFHHLFIAPTCKYPRKREFPTRLRHFFFIFGFAIAVSMVALAFSSCKTCHCPAYSMEEAGQPPLTGSFDPPPPGNPNQHL